MVGFPLLYLFVNLYTGESKWLSLEEGNALGGDWEAIKHDEPRVRQLLKALYWIPEDERKDHGGFGFGQLISCLEGFTLNFEYHG